MTRSRLLVFAAVFATLAGTSACSDSASPSSPDAATVQGSWTVTSQTVGGASTPAASLDGALVIAGTDLAFATVEPLGGLLESFSVSGDGSSLVAGGQTVPFSLAAGPTLSLQLPGSRTVVLAPDHGSAAATVTVAGTVTAPSATPSYVHPKVLIAFLDRTGAGFVSEDTRNYQDLTFTGPTASFAIDLDREALGTERLVFGPANVAIAIAFVVVFDDRDDDGKLADLFSACTGSSSDCVLGMSSIVLTSRSGTSPQLTASPFAYVRGGGWCQAVLVTDGRGGGTQQGLVALDAGKTLDFDVSLWADPTASSVPRLDLTVPTVN